MYSYYFLFVLDEVRYVRILLWFRMYINYMYFVEFVNNSLCDLIYIDFKF